MIYKIECLWCKKEKETYDSRAKYCSLSCGAKYQGKQQKESGYYERFKTGEYRICENNICNKKYYRCKSSIEKGENSHYCSSKCYYTYNGNWNSGLRKETDERVRKISKSISKYYELHPEKIHRRKITIITIECKFCKKLFQTTKGKRRLHCSMECTNKSTGERFSISTTRRHQNCELTPTTRCKYFKYTRKNGETINLQGSYEVKFATLLDSKELNYDVKKKSFKFIHPITERETRYTPDFFIHKFNRYIEIKGYWFEQEKKKFDAFQKAFPEIDIIVLQYKELYKISEEDLLKLVSTPG